MQPSFSHYVQPKHNTSHEPRTTTANNNDINNNTRLPTTDSSNAVGVGGSRPQQDANSCERKRSELEGAGTGAVGGAPFIRRSARSSAVHIPSQAHTMAARDNHRSPVVSHLSDVTT